MIKPFCEAINTEFADTIGFGETIWYEGLKEIKFKIQFRIQLGLVQETQYNNYIVGYTEFSLKDKDGENQTIIARLTDIFDVFVRHLRDNFW